MKEILLILLMGLFISQIAYSKEYKGVAFPGFIKGADVRYKDSNTVIIKTGYGDCNGKNWQITSDADLNLNDTDVLSGGIPYGADFIYIYVDYSEVDWGNALIIDDQPGTDVVGSLTEPSWSDDKQGWYNGEDRCIGVVWCAAGSGVISEFSNINNEYYLKSGMPQILDNGSPDSNWQFIEASAYTPVNAVGIYTRVCNADGNARVYCYIAPYENSTITSADFGFSSTFLFSWTPFERAWSRDLYWCGEDDDDNFFDILMCGYKIER